MFDKCDLKAVELSDNNTFLGIVKYNEFLVKEDNFLKPFLRDQNMKQIIRIGKKDYQSFDQFISVSLNDYYKKINNAKKEERERMLEIYNRLYQSFTLLNQAKQTGNQKAMDDYYDSISYQLYLIGYKMSNK